MADVHHGSVCDEVGQAMLVLQGWYAVLVFQSVSERGAGLPTMYSLVY